MNGNVGNTSQSQDRFNIELKSRVDSLDRMRTIAESVATQRLGSMHQVDTYFVGCRGRLKLREIDGQSAQLIWYERPDREEAKQSRYQLVDVANPAELKMALAMAYGIAKVVDKQREVYLYYNVRIHLDRVAGLGEFLEFEAVLETPAEAALGRSQVEQLRVKFGLQADWLLSGSYSDML